MMNDTYDRPREKMRDRGVTALSNTELLQVMIGSGSAGLPVTNIARKLEKVLRENGSAVVMDKLLTIRGLGTVKAGQILAGIEYAHRLEFQEAEYSNRAVDVLSDLYSDIRAAKKQTLMYVLFDGSGKIIGNDFYILDPSMNTARIARKIFGEALAQSTASVLVVIGYEYQVLEPSMYELSLARDIYSTAKLLSISIKSIVLVGIEGEYVLKRMAKT
jgi:DNA repair protein RadC